MGDAFQAVWFAAEGGSRPCRVELTMGSVVIEPPGGAAVRWPYSALESEIGGDDHDWAFLSCPPAGAGARLALRDPAAIAALAARTSGPVHDDLTGFDAARRRHASRHRRGLVTGLVALAAVALAGWLLLTRAAPEIVAATLPPASEKLLGEAVLAQMLVGETEIEAGPAAEAVRAIVARLAAAVEANPGYEFDVRLIESDVVNAAALPGGKIIVFSGLLAEAGSPDEVAGVLAHEIQHVLHRDALRGLVGRLGGSAVIALLLGGGDLARIAGQAGELDQLAYGRDQERAADRDGVLLLARAGLPPAALSAFFERLRAREGGKLPEFLSTHPDTAARIVELRRLAAATPVTDPRPLAVDWEAVRASLPGIQAPRREPGG
jgi:Zn-dependent protease with chaperone function